LCTCRCRAGLCGILNHVGGKVMRTMKWRYIRMVSGVLVMAAAAMVVFGHGCGKLESTNSGSDYFAANTCKVEGFESITVDPSTSTIAVVYQDVVLQNMLACTGVRDQASAQTMAEWENRKNSFSDYGSVLDVT